MAAPLVPIKWSAENYQLATQYSKLSREGQRVVHNALNGIDPNGIPGRVLGGHAVYGEVGKRKLIMQDSALRGAKTDMKGLDHMAFKLLDGTKSTTSTGDWHLYQDGGCTYVAKNDKGVLYIKYEYQGVAPAVPVGVSVPPPPSNNATDFPPLGGVSSSKPHQTGHNAQTKAPNQYKL